MTDDQGYGDTSGHGNPVLKTPNLDRLASEGVEFTQFTVCSNCSPTRAGLMTGRSNYRTGVTEVTKGNHLMYSDEVTIAEALGNAGYRTGIFGKWHLGSNYPMRPTDQGFQEALVHKGGGIGQDAGPPGNSYFDPILEHNNVSKTYPGYCDDIFADATIDFIKQKSDQPFFAYYATNLPHFPLDVPDEMADPYRKLGEHEHNATTFGMVANVDKNVGRLMHTLEQIGKRKNTIVLFLSDNGPRTRRTKNDVYPGRYVAGLRGTKTSNYENGIRVPFFIRWPDQLPSGKRIETMASHMDVLPTLLDACGIEPPKNVVIDGLSLLPLMTNKETSWPDRTLYFQWHAGPVPFEYIHFAARSQRYKLIQPQDNPHGFKNPPTTDELGRILDTLQLFDIQVDPSELNDISSQNPQIVEDMLRTYETWFEEVTRVRPYYVPERIQIGTPHQKHIILSRFDWRGVQDNNQVGHWEVKSNESAIYQITFRYDRVSSAGTAQIRYAGHTFEKPIEKGSDSATFKSVQLPAASGRFEAFLRMDRMPTAVRFVDVIRLN